MADNQIEIEIIARLDKLEDAYRRTEAAAKKTGDNVADAIGGKIKGAAIAAGAAIGTYLVGRGLVQSIKASIQQENAINRLNQSLANAGTFSREVSKRFQEFAGEIQRTTTVSDETVLSLASMARNFTNSNQQAEQLTDAAVKLAKATGMSLDGAVKNLGKTFAGLTGELGESLPMVRSLTVEQLKAGAAISMVAKRFNDAATGEVRTFSGALRQLANIWGDLGEEQGFIVTQSPSVVAAIKFISGWLSDFVKKMAEARESGGDVLKPFLTTAIDLARVMTYVLGPIVDFMISRLTKMGEAVGAFASAMVNLASGNFRSAMDDVKSAFSAAIPSSEDFQARGTQAALGFINGLQAAVSNAGDLTEQLRNNLGKPVQEVTQAMKDMAAIISGPVNNMIAAGVSSIGASLVQGGKAFGSFAKTALNILGDFAIQLGMFIIASDQAVIALKASLLSFFGGAGIVAGLALVAIGGAMKAFAGGPAAKGAVGGESGLTQSIGDPSTARPETEERQVGTNVEVNIAGSVLGDKRTLGREIAEALNEAFGTDGITIARGAVV